jgi:hypothetical protein
MLAHSSRPFPCAFPQASESGGLAAAAPELSPEHVAAILALFEGHVDAGLAWVRCNGEEAVPSVDNNLVASLAALLQV